MTEQPRPTIEHLLGPSPAQLQQEAALPSGYIPERWLQIEAIEVQRMREGLAQALKERVAAYPEGEVQRRSNTVRRYFGDLTLPPSFLDGPYAASRRLNFYEMLSRIVDVEQEEAIVPDVDTRVPFSSTGLDK